MAETAADVGVGISIWQVCVLMLLGKALKSLWIMINCLQFLVFISMWQVTYPTRVRISLSELKRIALGEFLDDFDMA